MKFRIILIIFLIVAGVAIPAKLAFDAINAQTAQAQDQAGTETGGTTDTNQSATRKFINNLGPNENTPAAYVTPSYDPFNNQYREQAPYYEQYPIAVQPNTKPVADFSIFTVNREGFSDKTAATAGTKYQFVAWQSTDEETSSARLQVRWDFEGDGIPDTYFSTVKTINHTFTEPGIYNVTLEVLDKGSAVSKAVKQIKIVNNTPPKAYQTIKVAVGTSGDVFEFDTSKSSDSQYTRQSLVYRFDWDNDGVWDTIYKTKTLWRHKFEKAGSYRVVMEVKDPEGLTSTWYRDIEVIENTPPNAQFTVTWKNGTFTFDAGASTDSESPKNLQYRWDYNYTGADDIVFDTGWSTSSKSSGSYGVPGHKSVRLQVKDADGAVSVAFAGLEVS